MNRINFNHLYYFYIVAKEGSIKSASEKLHISQPTISDQLKLIEEYFECLLFERKNRSLFLTTEGELALKYAEKIFDLGNEVTSRLRHRIELPKKSLDIGITQNMSHYFLYETILPLFEQEEVSISIVEDQRHLLLASLEKGKIDLIFTDSKDGVSSSVNSYRLGVNKTFAIAHKKYRKYKKNFPEKLTEVPYFNYTKDSFLKHEIDLFFSKNNISPRVIGEGDDVGLFQTITENGLAFTVVPEVSMSRICRNKDVIVLGELEELQTSIWGLIRKDYKGLGYDLIMNSKS